MKFFHLSDLHIGKHLHRYNLREDQCAVLNEVAEYARDIRPDAIVIAGDIYDKSVPSAEAVSVFDEFLTCIAEIEPAIPVLIISGNHDSAERLEYAAAILGRHHIHIAGLPPRNQEDHLTCVTLTDGYGEVDFYLMPFLKPAYVRQVFGGEIPQDYNDAVHKIIAREHIDYERRNVLLSHQFYAGNGKIPKTCDSEMIMVGGLDQVDISAIQKFDYAALGHIHGAQSAGLPYLRYCGTLLKYSVSEAGHDKALCVVTLGEKGTEAVIEELPLHPLRDVRAVRGDLEEVIRAATDENRKDYISVTLTDEIDPYKPKEQLREVYPNLLEIRVDNERTRKKLGEYDEEAITCDPLTAFGEFYQEMQGREMTEKEKEIIAEILDGVKED